MKKFSLFALVFIVAIAVFAVVLPASAAPACPDCVPAAQGKLVIRNLSDESIYVRLYGPASYALPVPAYTTKIYTIAVGDYSYQANMCGGVRKGEFHQSRGQYTLRLKHCPPPEIDHTQVTGDWTAKLVSVKIVNTCANYNTVTLVGDKGDTYYFSLAPGETGHYTIVGKYTLENPYTRQKWTQRETYRVTCSVCGTVDYWTPTASNSVFKTSQK